MLVLTALERILAHVEFRLPPCKFCLPLRELVVEFLRVFTCGRAEPRLDWARDLHDWLGELAERRGLDHPAWGPNVHAAWTEWLAVHGPSLPARLRAFP